MTKTTGIRGANHGRRLLKFLKSEGRKWGVGSVVVESAFLGRPDFQSRGPKTLILKVSERFGANIWGAPNADPTTTDPTPHVRPSDERCPKSGSLGLVLLQSSSSPAKDSLRRGSCHKVSRSDNFSATEPCTQKKDFL